MRIIEVEERTPDLINRLLVVWENSVKGYPSNFLSDSEIKSIKDYVPQALKRGLHI